MTEQITNYPWGGRFQTKEEIERYLSGDSITCLLCGKDFRSLADHIKYIHHSTADAYKVRYGIYRTRGLVCSATRKKMSALMKDKQSRGITAPQPTPEIRQMAYEALRKASPPMVPATVHAASRNALRWNGYTRAWGIADYEEYVRRLAKGRTIREVGLDPDMPANYLFDKYRRKHPEFNRWFEEVWETVPFDVQVRGQHPSRRYYETILKLREFMHLTWPVISSIMNVKENTVRGAYHYLKHEGDIEAYRERVRRCVEEYGLM